MLFGAECGAVAWVGCFLVCFAEEEWVAKPQRGGLSRTPARVGVSDQGVNSFENHMTSFYCFNWVRLFDWVGGLGDAIPESAISNQAAIAGHVNDRKMTKLQTGSGDKRSVFSAYRAVNRTLPGVTQTLWLHFSSTRIT